MKANFRYLGWAWIIIVGGLMITPGGIECIRCGAFGTRILGVISILIGIAGIVAEGRRRPAAVAVAGDTETTDDTPRAAAPDAVFGMADFRKGGGETSVALDDAAAASTGGGVLPPRGPIPSRKGGAK